MRGCTLGYVIPRLCVCGCGRSLPLTARRHAKYYNPACRVAAHRARSTPRIPVELQGLPRWVRWSSRQVPLTVDGRVASSTDPGTWSSYAKARRSTAGAGLGFVLNGDGIVCLDLDRCISESGALSEGAATLLDLTGTTYVE
jgi:hypothetical protein